MKRLWRICWGSSWDKMELIPVGRSRTENSTAVVPQTLSIDRVVYCTTQLFFFLRVSCSVCRKWLQTYASAIFPRRCSGKVAKRKKKSLRTRKVQMRTRTALTLRRRFGQLLWQRQNTCEDVAACFAAASERSRASVEIAHGHLFSSGTWFLASKDTCRRDTWLFT